MGNGTYYIQPPLHKGLWTPQSMEICTRPIGSWGKSLTLWAHLYVILSVLEYLWPVISLVNGFVGEGSYVRVVLTVAAVDFTHQFLRFLWSEGP